MDRIAEYATFLAVARTGGFTTAAHELGLTPSAVSKQIRALEDRLGVRLLQRTTRRVTLTDAGRAFRERAQGILEQVDEAEQVASVLGGSLRGRLRIGLPMDFGRAHLAAPVADFAARHPDLVVEAELSDRFVDLVEDGLDVAVRIGELSDSSLVARWLAPCRRVICASPAYLASNGRPRQPGELRSHRRIAYAYEVDHRWRFAADDTVARSDREVEVPVGHRANNGEVARAFALAGLGLALLPTFLVGDDLRAGRLERVLGERFHDEIPIHALYPHRRHLSAKVRAFVDHLVERCGAAPYWDEGLFDGST